MNNTIEVRYHPTLKFYLAYLDNVEIRIAGVKYFDCIEDIGDSLFLYWDERQDELPFEPLCEYESFGTFVTYEEFKLKFAEYLI